MYFSQKSFENYKKLKEEQQKILEKQNKKRISKERYWNKTCIECNEKLLNNARFCSNCWADQYKECKVCGNLMPKAYDYCEKCGNKN